MNSAIGKRLVLVLLLLAALVSLASGIKNAYHYSQDFQWDAAEALRLGYDPYDLSLGVNNVENIPELDDFYNYFESIEAKQKMEANQFPSLLILLFIYTLMPYRTAVLIWLISNLIFTAVIIYLLRKGYMKNMDRGCFAALSLLMIAGTPWRNQIGVGQHTLFAFMFFLLAVFLSDNDNDMAAGLALAVSYFKYTLTAPLALIFIYRRKWKSFFISLGVHILLTVLSALWLRESFIDMLIKPLRVSSALAGEGSIDLSAILGGSKIAMIIALLVMCALFIFSLKMRRENEELLFSLYLLVSLIITYHRSYDFFVLTAVYSGVNTLACRLEGRGGKILRISYFLFLLYLFFGLRIFSESEASLALAALLYYTFLIVYTLLVLRPDEGFIQKG